ncbi:hypothetical protein BJF90_10045 [Pseudonocardia sp. CNS-004]|nr:hypothetical protein BJF90_10045 [Pseudonocardia sp. CNS-004]
MREGEQAVHRDEVEQPAPRDPVEHVERLQRAAGAVPPVAPALVDPAVRGERREVAVDALDAQPERLRTPLGRVEGEGGDDQVAVDPRVPVVDAADPVPVAAGVERVEHAVAHFGGHPREQAGVGGVELLAEHERGDGEGGGGLPGTEVEVGPVQVGDDSAGAGERVVVRGPAPRALLGHDPRPVGDVVEGAARGGDRGEGGGARDAPEPAPHDLLVRRALAAQRIGGVVA